MCQRDTLVSKVKVLQTKRVAIYKFISRCDEREPITKHYLLPAYMDFEEVSATLHHYKGRLRVLEQEIQEFPEEEWDVKQMSIEFDI